MKDFEEFKNKILGKIYLDKYNDDKVYVVCEVCGSPSYDNTLPISEAVIIYVSISIPNNSTMTTYSSENDKIQIDHSRVNFKNRNEIRRLKDNCRIPKNIGLDKIADYYKIFDNNIKCLLKGIGTPL